MFMLRTKIGCLATVAALALVSGLNQGAIAHEEGDWCNPVKDGSGNPVRQGRDVALYALSERCKPKIPPPDSGKVYFEFDKWDLNAAAIRAVDTLIQEIEDAEAEVQAISVDGHTDTAGAPDYNDPLSQRRATELAVEFIKREVVPAADVYTRAMGERDLAVETGDDVREPRNRRAVVRFEYPPVESAAD